MNFYIEKSKDGYNLLKISKDNKEVYIGSKYNHNREINKFMLALEPLKDKNYIIFGLSLGEHIRELLKYSDENTKILIIEPNKELYKYICESKLIEDVVKDNRVKIITDKGCIDNFFEANISGINVESYSVTYYLNYNKVFNEEFKELYESVKENISRLIIERNTQLHFADTWTRTFFENVKSLKHTNTINDLANKYKNVPAIIVSAGPSLKKNIDQLKNAKNLLILSGGRTLQALEKIHVKSNALVVADAGDISYNLVSDYIKDLKCPLFFHEGTNSKILKEHNGKKIIGTDNEFINSIYELGSESIKKGGSVAHSMTYLAAYLGCNPIIFIGQDLAYTYEELHSDICKNKNQNYTAADFSKTDDLYVKDIYGNVVKTSIVLNSFRVDLEKIIEEFPKIDFINATEGGAMIKGTKVDSLKNVIDTVTNRKIEPISTYLYDVDNGIKISNEMNCILKTLDNLCITLEKGRVLLDRFKYKDKTLKRDMELNEIELNIQENIKKMSVFTNAFYKIYYYANNSEIYKLKKEDSEETVDSKKNMRQKYIYDELYKVLINNRQVIVDIIEEMKCKE